MHAIEAGALVRNTSRQLPETIALDQIQSWCVERDTPSDWVHIRLLDGRVVSWRDEDYHLLSLLEEAIGAAGTRELVDIPTQDAV